MTLGESHFQCILVFPVQPFQSILILIFIFFPFWQRIYRCGFSNPNCQISFWESCGKLNHLLVSCFLDNYLSSTEFCVYMFLCVRWVGGGYIVGEDWGAEVICLMMIETEIYWLHLTLLQRHIYGLKGRNIDVFAENSSLAINPHYIQSWLDLLSRTPRVAPFLQKNDPFIAALKKVWTVPTIAPDSQFACKPWHCYSGAGTIWTHCWCTCSKWCPWWHVPSHF